MTAAREICLNINLANVDIYKHENRLACKYALILGEVKPETVGGNR